MPDVTLEVERAVPPRLARCARRARPQRPPAGEMRCSPDAPVLSARTRRLDAWSACHSTRRSPSGWSEAANSIRRRAVRSVRSVTPCRSLIISFLASIDYASDYRNPVCDINRFRVSKIGSFRLLNEAAFRQSPDTARNSPQARPTRLEHCGRTRTVPVRVCG